MAHVACACLLTNACKGLSLLNTPVLGEAWAVLSTLLGMVMAALQRGALVLTTLPRCRCHAGRVASDTPADRGTYLVVALVLRCTPITHACCGYQLVICTLYATVKSNRFFVAMSKVLWEVFLHVRHPKSPVVRAPRSSSIRQHYSHVAGHPGQLPRVGTRVDRCVV